MRERTSGDSSQLKSSGRQRFGLLKVEKWCDPK
jgi:hypothetical protein